MPPLPPCSRLPCQTQWHSCLDPREACPQLQYLHNKLCPPDPALSGSDRPLCARHIPGVSLYRFGLAEYAEYGLKGKNSSNWQGAGSSATGFINKLDSLQTYVDIAGPRVTVCALSTSPDLSRSMQLTCCMPWHTSPKSSSRGLVSLSRACRAAPNSSTPRELFPTAGSKLEQRFMPLSGEDTVSKPKDTDTALLSSAVVGHAQVSAVSNRCHSFIIKEFDVPSKSDKLERRAIFSSRRDCLTSALAALRTSKTTRFRRENAYPMTLRDMSPRREQSST